MKQVLALMLALVLVLCLFGCGAGETAPAQTAPETTVPEETTVPPTEAETEPPVTEPVFDLSTWQGNYDQGLYFTEEKRWQEAYDAFDAAVALDPQLPDAYAQRGNALILLEENEENLSLAWNDYQQALKLDEANALAYLGVVDVHIRRAEYDEAEAAMDEAVEKTNNNSLLHKKADQLNNGNFVDSSEKNRYGRTKYYNGQGKYCGCVIRNYDNGIIISVESFNAKGKTTGFVEVSTVTNGNVEEKVWYNVNTRLSEMEVVVLKTIKTTTTNPDGTYDVESVSFDRNGNRSSSGHTYFDADGRSVRHESYDADGNMQLYTTTEYDSEGKIIRGNNYNADGTLDQYQIHEYNSSGEKTRVNMFDGNDQLMSYTLYVYNEQGNLLGHESYWPNGELQYSAINE